MIFVIANALTPGMRMFITSLAGIFLSVDSMFGLNAFLYMDQRDTRKLNFGKIELIYRFTH